MCRSDRRRFLRRLPGTVALARLPMPVAAQPKDAPLRVGYISFSDAGMTGPLQRSFSLRCASPAM